MYPRDPVIVSHPVRTHPRFRRGRVNHCFTHYRSGATGENVRHADGTTNTNGLSMSGVRLDIETETIIRFFLSQCFVSDPRRGYRVSRCQIVIGLPSDIDGVTGSQQTGVARKINGNMLIVTNKGTAIQNLSGTTG